MKSHKNYNIVKLDIAASASMLFYAASVVLFPIAFVKIGDELSFSLVEGGGVAFIKDILLAAMLVFTIWAVSLIKKVDLIIRGLILQGVGLLITSFTGSVVGLAVALGLTGIGGGLIEALINPFVHNIHREDSGKSLNIVNGFFSVGVLVAVLISGALLNLKVNWRVLYIGLSVIHLVPVSLFLVCRKFSLLYEQPTKIISYVPSVLKRKEFYFFALLIFFAGAIEGGFLFWSASYIQLKFGSTPLHGSIGTALFAGSMAVGRMVSGWLVGKIGLYRLLLFSTLLGIAVTPWIFFANNLLSFYLILTFTGLSIACYWPTIQAYSATVIREDSTLLFILLSCAGIPGFGLIIFLMGVLGEAFSLQISFLLVILSLVAIATLLAAHKSPSWKRRAEKR